MSRQSVFVIRWFSTNDHKFSYHPTSKPSGKVNFWSCKSIIANNSSEDKSCRVPLRSHGTEYQVPSASTPEYGSAPVHEGFAEDG